MASLMAVGKKGSWSRLSGNRLFPLRSQGPPWGRLFLMAPAILLLLSISEKEFWTERTLLDQLLEDSAKSTFDQVMGPSLSKLALSGRDEPQDVFDLPAIFTYMDIEG